MQKKLKRVLVKKEIFKKGRWKGKISKQSMQPGTIRFGKPVFEVTFKTIKILAVISFVLLVCNIFMSLSLFSSSIRIRNHLGHFINMISKGDGDTLPSLQAVPVVFFLLVDLGFALTLFNLFNRAKKSMFNWLLFVLIMLSVLLIVVTLILFIVISTHSHAEHEELHIGIVEAMRNYSSNSWYKVQMDRLQIEFQCCGSKKYDEWYNITWFDSNLAKKAKFDNSQGHTPFSCCSKSSIFPCIHHNIENTGRVYLYTPEQNLSISMDGCYVKLRKKKQEIGLIIIGNLFLYIVLQTALVICMRFLQTAHFMESRFHGHIKLYKMWLIGCYTGDRKYEAETSE